jgi:hypothetical protein
VAQTHCRFGVEQENFILHEDGTSPTHAEVDDFYSRLCEDGYQGIASNSMGQVLGVKRSTEFGELVVSNDGYTHILEVAFPPTDNLELFHRIYLEVFSKIQGILSELGLRVRSGAALNPPVHSYARPKANDIDGSRLAAILSRDAINHPLFHSALPACIASTQVSLNIADAEAIRKLSLFYEFEPLVPLLFGNSPEFNGVHGQCVRPLAWMANFPPSYQLLGIPEPIPGSLSEYEQMRQASHIRDFSFVSIRSSERVEFRSACSQDSVDDILWLIRFRLAVDRVCDLQRQKSPENQRERFIIACTAGPTPWSQELFQELVAIDPLLAELSPRLNPVSSNLDAWDQNHAK